MFNDAIRNTLRTFARVRIPSFIVVFDIYTGSMVNMKMLYVVRKYLFFHVLNTKEKVR